MGSGYTMLVASKQEEEWERGTESSGQWETRNGNMEELAKLNFFVSPPVMEGLICFGLSLCLSFLLLSTTPSSSFFCLQCCFKR
jgi:hypothetical protein